MSQAAVEVPPKGGSVSICVDSEGLTEEGVNLVCEAICSGIFNDLGSGSNVDVCVITKGHKEYLRNHLLPNPRTYVSSKGFSFPKKTEVLFTRVTALKEMVEVIEGGDEMEELIYCSTPCWNLHEFSCTLPLL